MVNFFGKSCNCTTRNCTLFSQLQTFFPSSLILPPIMSQVSMRVDPSRTGPTFGPWTSMPRSSMMTAFEGGTGNIKNKSNGHGILGCRKGNVAES